MRNFGWIQNGYALGSLQSSRKLITMDRMGLDRPTLAWREVRVNPSLKDALEFVLVEQGKS